MTEIHRSITPSGAATIRAPRHLQITSRSPERQHKYHEDTEDLLRSLKPFCVIDSLRAPIGALKTCLEEASSSEHAFAMRAAVASKCINDWYEEISEWPWPRGGGSAGFEPPSFEQRQLSGSIESTVKNSGDEDEWQGSILSKDLVRFQTRVDKIIEEMGAMDLEEMKTTVLHHHILPLSRPGTPYSDAGQSITSALSYVKMEDVTAVITAIILYCLPILSRLSKLLNAWSIRLSVLDKIPELLLSLDDVETALKAGWDIIAPDEDPDTSQVLELSQGTFDVMRQTLQPKVDHVCKLMDFMLDSLEASRDTVPDSWIDRVDKVEQSWRQWVVAGEHRVKGGEWSRFEESTVVEEPERKLTIQIEAPSPTKENATDEDFPSSPPLPPDYYSSSDSSNPETPERSMSLSPESKPRTAAIRLQSPVKMPKRKPEVSNAASGPNVFERLQAKKPQPSNLDGANDTKSKAPPASIGRTRAPKIENLMRKFSGENLAANRATSPPKTSRATSTVLSEVNRNIIRTAPTETLKQQPPVSPTTSDESSDLEWDSPTQEGVVALNSSFMESSILETVEEEETLSEPELPPHNLRTMASVASFASTVVHDTSRFGEDASESFREDSQEPELPPLPDPDQPLFSSDAVSPPSSPPLRYGQRTTSVSFDEQPRLLPSEIPLTEEYLNSSAIFDADTSMDFDRDLGSHSRMSMISNMSEGEDHMQRQIREVLQNIPAKIKLSRAKRPVDLNPPDLQLPGKPRARVTDGMRRSTSALSSRAGTPGSWSRSGTPSFMLAPVREPRQRSKSSQEIKTYHLSRSTGEAPIKLFIRCVGENGERVMVRVGGGWSDLGEYLKEYAAHHGRKSKGEGKVEVRDSPQAGPSRIGSSPSNRSQSAMETPSTPLAVRKTRRSVGEHDARRIRTPISRQATMSPSPDFESSRISSRTDFDEETSSLGLAGPNPARKEMSEESKAWVESVKEKVRLVSGERIPQLPRKHSGSFGTLDKVGGTTRLFRKN